MPMQLRGLLLRLWRQPTKRRNSYWTSKSHEQEAQSLRENLKGSEKGKKEAEAKIARLLGEKKEMEAKLENMEKEFVVNFYNTEAYTNFSNYFARVGHQEVLTMLRTDHPSLYLGPLEARFPPPNVEDEEDSLGYFCCSFFIRGPLQ
ncbi:hypothetical protein Adt_33744 [Abeliophyllum distichum]|uniref:Uncharacterized protein n=1 Tax=Abeliophyllum distichum TaxID=126358 RepID=A0ABD1QX97_9LAMI